MVSNTKKEALLKFDDDFIYRKAIAWRGVHRLIVQSFSARSTFSIFMASTTARV